MKRICVFCGSSEGSNLVYAAAARQIGLTLAQRGLGLVYGGGSVGLMGVVADTVLEHGSQAIGVMPKALVEKEVEHRGLTKLHVVDSMHERKAMMTDLADGFIALPGGFGTFEEFCEVLTWAQLGYHRKPCGLLNIERYYDPLLALFDRAVDQGFVRAGHRAIVLVDTSPERLLDQFDTYKPPMLPKWVDRGET